MPHSPSILLLSATATALIVAAAARPEPVAEPAPSTALGSHLPAPDPLAALPAAGTIVEAPCRRQDRILAAGTTLFPDGSRLPALNGVAADLRMPWPGGGPFSPVVDVLEHAGTQWYRHADGSMSTTLLRCEQTSGQQVAVPICYRPEATIAARRHPVGR